MNEDTNKSSYRIYLTIDDLVNYIRRYISINIPSKDRDMRIHLLDECYNLQKNMFYATYNKGNIRMKYLIEMKVNISLIDNLLLQFRKIKCIKKHYIDVSISKLNDIKNIVYGWIYNEEKKKTS